MKRRGTRARRRLLEAIDDVADSDMPPVGEVGLIVRDLARRVHAETALLAVQDQDSENVGVVLAAWGGVSGSDGLPFLSPADGFVGRVLSSGHAAVEPLDPDQDRSLGIAVSGARLTWTAGAAVTPPGRPPGALCVGFSDGPTLDPPTILWLVESYARLAALCLHEAGMLDGLVESARVDGLTGCLDYAAIRSELDREIGRCTRHRRALSCCFIDLDGFKRVNDRHGHPYGNSVLAEIAAVLREGVRLGDSVGRYGGDEFVAILPDTDQAGAYMLAERLRSMISATTLIDDRVRLDASVGVALWRPGTTTDELLAEADQALLQAKRAGGGIVLTASRTTRAGWPLSSTRDGCRATGPIRPRFASEGPAGTVPRN